MKLSELIDKYCPDADDRSAASIPARLHECVKPLVWSEWLINPQLTSAKSHKCWGGVSELNLSYEVAEIVGGFVWYKWNYSYQYSDVLPTLDAAKAAAQAHYAKQIIEGLNL